LKYKTSPRELPLQSFVNSVAAHGVELAEGLTKSRHDLLDGRVRDSQDRRVCDDEESGGAESEPKRP